jgi:DNA replication and repair protein RecF
MYLKRLTLHNLRNYSDETFTFNDGVNVFVGANAQGKTNVAESIFFACTGYSPRANRDRELIKQGENDAFILAEAESAFGSVSIEVRLSQDGEKEIFVNGVKLNKMGELFGNINSVFFNPQELKLVQESPEDRRRFMNISLSQMSKRYFYALLRYNKILEQRNNLLKSHDRHMVLETLPIWDESLCKESAKIFSMRNEFLDKISPYCIDAHTKLSGGLEELKMTAENALFGTEEEIAKTLVKRLKNSYEKDLRLGFTTVGPHRDDLNIFINGIDAKLYASQGQMRTAALSLKLAQVEFFKQLSGEYPVLILDDVMSELDLPRRKKLLQRIHGMQTLLTCTHAERVLYGKECNKIRIENGRIKG